MNKLFTIIALLTSLGLTAQVRLPRIIRDSMVLQRDAPIKIWGWAKPNEKIKINFNKAEIKTTADAEGKWLASLPAMKAGGPFTMDIKGTNKITLKEILIGDVWICSGQSNMVLPMERVKEKYPEEISSANYPEIRHFFIPTLTDLNRPKDDLPSGSWKSANPTDVLGFSATAYFFAKNIYDKYKVPIGLINASVGGTPIEAWISEQGLKDFHPAIDLIKNNKDTAYINSFNKPFEAPKSQDKGMLSTVKWYDPHYVPVNWHPINIPGYWEDQGVRNLDGVVWYRKEIDVPESMTNMPAKLFMGRIVDADYVYVNGKQIGNITYQYPPRRYDIPADLLKPGKNMIVIRVINTSGKGGFVPDKPYNIIAGNQSIDLKGTWQYKVGEVFLPSNAQGNARISFQNQPASLYNAMIAPLINYSAKGFLWYQGEANTNNAADYKKLLPALIADWRSKWKQGDLPFLFVQLSNFMDVQYVPSESSWAMLRESQMKALSVPNTGMAVTIDIGEWNDIHPLNKKDVGVRLALAAQKLAYGEKNIVSSGPLFESQKIEGNKIILSFSNTGSGLIAIDNQELNQFSIARDDKKFVWAKAEIKDNTVIVSSEQIPNPKYVRYAWADNPRDANLFNKDGFPASPFRTDQ